MLTWRSTRWARSWRKRTSSGSALRPVDLRRLLLTTEQHERLFLTTSVALPSVAVLTGGLVVGLRRLRARRR